MEEKIDRQSVDRLNIVEKNLNALKDKNIQIIGDLCKKSKTNLKEIGLSQNEINCINIELQLLRLCLRNSL